MPVFVDALVGDTLGLSAEEFGAYCLILFSTWRNNGVALVDDDKRMARICRMTEKRWRERIRPALIGFFDLSGGTWRQGRLEKEWNFVAKQVEQKRSAGKASAAAKLLKTKDDEPTAVDEPLQQEGQQPTPTPTEEVGSDNQSIEPEGESSKAARGAPRCGKYAFAGSVVRLTSKDLEQWQRVYHAIPDIIAALVSLDAYYKENLKGDDRKNWFVRCSTALGKKHQEYLSAERMNANGKQSAVAKLYEGALLAAEEWERRQGNCGDSFSSDVPLLDRRRPH